MAKKPCRTCGVEVFVTPKSLPEPTCRTCRRAQWPRCRACGDPFRASGPTQVYCSLSCRPRRPATTCDGCGQEFWRKGSNKDAHRYCSRACAAEHRKAKKWDWVCYLTHSKCGHCNAPIVSRYARAYCSSACRYQSTKPTPTERKCSGCEATVTSPRRTCDECLVARKKASKARSSKRRKQATPSRNANDRGRHITRRTGAEYEPINTTLVLERDGWCCGICGDAISRDAKWPDQMCPSLDHVIPLSLGGSHTYSNVQASHWLCNVLKSDDEAMHFRVA